MKYLLIVTTLLCLIGKLYALTPEEAAATFFSKITKEADFEGAWKMLSKESQQRTTERKWLEKTEKLKNNKKLIALYKYEGEHASFKIIDVKQRDDNLYEVTFRFNKIVQYKNFIERYLKVTTNIKTDDPSVAFSRQNRPHFNFGGWSLYKEYITSFEIVKESGDLKIKINSPSRFLQSDSKFLGHYMDAL